MFKFMAINYDNNDSNVIIIIIGTQQAEKQSITERKTFSLFGKTAVTKDINTVIIK